MVFGTRNLKYWVLGPSRRGLALPNAHRDHPAFLAETSYHRILGKKWAPTCKQSGQTANRNFQVRQTGPEAEPAQMSCIDSLCVPNAAPLLGSSERKGPKTEPRTHTSCVWSGAPCTSEPLARKRTSNKKSEPMQASGVTAPVHPTRLRVRAHAGGHEPEEGHRFESFVCA